MVWHTMTQSDFFTLYIATIAIIGGLSGYVITHLTLAKLSDSTRE
jgi:hypothetical protein